MDGFKRKLPWISGTLAVTAAAGAILAAPISLTLAGVALGVSACSGLVSWGTRKDARDYANKGESRVASQGPVEVVQKGPSRQLLEGVWQKNLQQWPQARHVVYVSGHGERFQVAGLGWSELAQTVKGAELVILDACNGAQLETLSHLSESIEVAIASEHPVRASGMPIEDFFRAAPYPKEPTQLAASMVLAGDRRRPAPSLVAVDLQVLGKQLLPALDRLGRQLQQVPAEKLKAVLQKTEQPDSVEQRKTYDLGSFLYRLGQSQDLQSPALENCTRAFQETMLAMVGHGTLSFDLYPAGSKLPQGWTDFLRHCR